MPMNLRHTTAFVLVGWYFIVPPFQGSSPESAHTNTGAPWSHWQIWSGYDSAKQCNEETKHFYEVYLTAKNRLGSGKVDELAQKAGFTGDERKIFAPWMENAFSYGVCVPSDDPRLKGK
jgi:hypothetical protein